MAEFAGYMFRPAFVFECSHLILPEMDSLSAWAKDAKERSHHFAGHRRGVNVLFSRSTHADPERFQLSESLSEHSFVLRAKREMDFYQHPVDQPSAAICRGRWKSSRFRLMCR